MPIGIETYNTRPAPVLSIQLNPPTDAVIYTLRYSIEHLESKKVSRPRNYSPCDALLCPVSPFRISAAVNSEQHE